MAQTKTVASLFDEKPIQWGLRGDPHLWQEMRVHFASTPLPAAASELDVLLETAFETLTGHSIAGDEHFFIERFDHGGMSSGYISPKFWREKVMPLLHAHYAAIVST
ncbi:MAG: hypothetical protein KDJ52_24585 [Anaerolineae bacterium]|nr:hypothetical protein [Anaerolineae bacterium]